MSFGSAENYQGSGEIEVLRSGANTWVKAYNGTGSAILNGKVKRIYVEVDTGADPDCARYTIVAPQTAATADQRICVVDNGILGKASIANGEYGFVCIGGQCEALGGATISANQGLEVLNATEKFIDVGVASSGDLPAETSAIAIDAMSLDTYTTVFVLNRETVTKAS